MNRLCVLHGFTPKPAISDELAGHHLEAETEATLHLPLPLQRHRRRAHDQDEVRLLAKDELLQDEARLDRLPEADVVGDEQVGAG